MPLNLWEKYRGKKVLIVGFTARTGLATLKIFLKHGISVWISDQKPESEIKKILGTLIDQNPNSIKIYSGPQKLEQLEGIDFILLSPGVPRSIPLLVEAKKRNLPINNDIDFIFPFMPVTAKVIAVTGTDGKSTVTELIHFVLKNHALSVACGNNGVPVFEVYDEIQKAAYIVMEVSSYMLEDLKHFHPHVALVTNVAEDHLDRYDSLQAYAETKWQCAKFMTSKDHWIKNLDNAWTKNFSPSQAKVVGVSAKEKADFYFAEGKFFLNQTTFLYQDCLLKGAHHIENILVSIGVLKSLGLEEEMIAKGIKAFPGLPHRLEFVPTKKDIQVFDDSKATTIQSVLRAIESFEKNVILILGGKDKGLDFSELSAQLKRVKLLIAYGEARGKITSALPFERTESIGSFDEAVRIAWAKAEKSDVILLSPACTSWDQHKDYVERGTRFKTLIHEMDHQV